MTLYHGDCLDVLAGLPSGSVHMCATSPPFYGLRSYIADGHADKPLEIGLEETPQDWCDRLVAVFREVWRVLRDDGTCWIEVGDSYAASTKGAGGAGKQHTNRGSVLADRSSAIPEGLKQKDLIGQPWRLAFALQARGWFLRSEIIWSRLRPNPMPESVTDRPTKSHSTVFLLSKRPRYFYDADAIREPLAGFLSTTGKPAPRARYGGTMPSERRGEAHLQPAAKAKIEAGDWSGFSGGSSGGANARSVWQIPGGTEWVRLRPDLSEDDRSAVLDALRERGLLGGT